jgi:hypothetical protein
MVLVFVERTDAFAIHYETFEGGALLVCHLQRLGPYPQALGARIDCWAHAESSVLPLVEQYSVQEEGLACAVLASDCNHSDAFVAERLEQLDCLGRHLEAGLVVKGYEFESVWLSRIIEHY